MNAFKISPTVLLRNTTGSRQPVNYFTKRSGVGEITTDKPGRRDLTPEPPKTFRLNNANGVISGKGTNSLRVTLAKFSKKSSSTTICVSVRLGFLELRIN